MPGYGGRGYYRSWRGRDYAPPKYVTLNSFFGPAVGKIKSAFFKIDKDALDELFDDYGAIYGSAAERYARQTFPKWRSGATQLSGQVMERLIELVPPYLEPARRLELLTEVVRYHKPRKRVQTIVVDLKSPEKGIANIEAALAEMNVVDPLAHVPENVMNAAKWLYDDDMTVARAVIAEVEARENAMMKEHALREISLLERTIKAGQVKAASYTVEMPAGKLAVVVNKAGGPCFVATACFGCSAPQTNSLREFRDGYIVRSSLGRALVTWYYNHGSKLARMLSCQPLLRWVTRATLNCVVSVLEATIMANGRRTG